MCWESHKYRASKTFPKAAPQMWFPWRNGITLVYEEYRDFLGSSVVKNLPANAGDIRDTGLIPAWGRSPWGGHDNPPQYSCLENPVNRGAWYATVHGVAKSRTRLSDFTSLHFIYIYLTNSCEKKRSKKQRRKGKIFASDCRVPNNSKER